MYLTKENAIAGTLAIVAGMSISVYADSTRTYTDGLLPRPAAVTETVVPSADETPDAGGIDNAMLIARLIEAAAADQDSYGKRLIADVVLNRVADPTFPDTVAQVIEDPGQFVQLADIYSIEVSKTDESYVIACEELIDQTDYDVLYFDCNGWPEYGTPKLQAGSNYFSE